MPGLRRPILLGCAALVGVVVVGGTAAAALAGTSEDVPSGVRVLSIPIEGLSRSAAVAKLDAVLGTALSEPLTLVADTERLPLDPDDAGLTIDFGATVDEALDVGVIDRLRTLVGSTRSIDPVTRVDAAVLRTAVSGLVAKVDRAPREGSIGFTTAPLPVAVYPLTGRTLSVDGAVEAVAAAWESRAEGPIAVPVQVVETAMTTAEVDQALTTIAAPAVAASVTVTAGSDTLVVTQLAIAKALRLEVRDGAFVPRLLPEVLAEQLASGLARIGQPPVDASFEVATGTPVVVPGKVGTGIAPTDLAAAVLPVLGRQAPRTASAPLTQSQPRVSTEQARGLGVVEKIGGFTTRHPCCRPRVQNIHRMADLVDGYVLLPGETFDLNALIGPRDKGRGFVEAPQILDGEFVDRVGGGVSQFATTLYNAVFFSGLKDVEHQAHSYFISRYPPGREATVSFPKPDLRFLNDSGHGVLIDTSYTGTTITVTFWGTKRWADVRSETGPRTRPTEFRTQYVQRDDCTATAGERGFDIVVTRVLVAPGGAETRERIRTRYKAEPRFVCGPPPG